MVKVPVPQHCCLLAAQLPLAARPLEKELSPFCSLPPAVAVLGPAPSPELTKHFAVPPNRWTPAAGMPGKQDPGTEQSTLAGPIPTPSPEATHSPVCSGWTVDTL